MGWGRVGTHEGMWGQHSHLAFWSPPHALNEGNVTRGAVFCCKPRLSMRRPFLLQLMRGDLAPKQSHASSLWWGAGHRLEPILQLMHPHGASAPPPGFEAVKRLPVDGLPAV